MSMSLKLGLLKRGRGEEHERVTRLLEFSGRRRMVHCIAVTHLFDMIGRVEKKNSPQTHSKSSIQLGIEIDLMIVWYALPSCTPPYCISFTHGYTFMCRSHSALNGRCALSLTINRGRTTDLNLKYRLCASYPNVLVVPSSVTNSEVEASAQFRSEQRLPVLCWGRQSDSASIWRSSQPKVKNRK